MRHRKKGRTLDRKKSHRDALLRNQAIHFFGYGTITTTLAKAKFLRPFIEKLITYGKKKDLSTLRFINQQLHSIKITKKIINEISPKYLNRKGGYVRILKLRNRLGDGAPLAKIELIENETKVK